ncbi:hypothetical protein Vadar_020055 [Vaccinium darrowii]|uniref:Uncharacterized protein n=1 Tax=Vaccinium darrowii TaxID=229202 RepID=A0ACB7YX68_9ERIC|nr:hypothetical protein Vadar_020055 [Vaccinium darrowii]
MSDQEGMSGTAPEGVLSMEEMARLNEMGEVVTQGQNLSPEDEESLTRVTDELSHVGKVAGQPDKQILDVPDPKSKGDEGSERLQLQLHQYTDPLKGISDRGSTSGTAPEGGVLFMEELVVTEGQDLFPQDEESLTKLTEDLSGTNMYTLPQYIFGLVALKKLLLRNCEILMMELPPEIGELKNLEVLDLEGTEILCLPMEIAELVNLTCLKVSFYGYANQTVIPKTVLSNLSRLEELIIDVTPYGEWWDVEVKAIIDDLRSLKELTSLKLYLPTAELLEDLALIFPGLANFRFTVGRHEEHFISRLSRGVEEEFNNREKLEKGLKFINGNCIPNEITKVLKHANAFFLQRHWTAESLSEFGHENLNEVKFFLVIECNEFQTIIDFEKLYRGKDGRAEFEVFPDFDEAMVLGSLERLIIRYMKNMESIWKGPVGKGSLSNLKSLALHTCPKLTTLFTIDMLSNLINLEELIVEDCPKINSLVSLQNSCSKSLRFLPSLKKISLLHLPGLVSISSGLGIAPKLERMVVFYCPKLEKLSATEVSSTELKVIKGEKEWWDALKWYESDLSTEDEDYLARLFIPFRRDGDLMAQLTEGEIAGYGQGEVGSFKILDCLSNFSEEELLEEIPSEELEEIPSEELEETPSNPQELEDLIRVSVEFPPILSHDDFSIFQVLDLSYTEIKSLPQSISSLVSLQKLFLRSCALLMMELPPEIGELTNLEVLDLEGTEILCLPKEIAKLVNLTSLKVSIYGYANQTVIPRSVLSNLSRLNELIIDVTPYGEWWDVEVEAIINDLRSLKELRTLKLYLPAAELLEELTVIFPGLAKFRFTVGRYEEHFISRLPRDVEEEFNNQDKLEKGLKFINGICIPNEIAKVFNHADAFHLQRHWTAQSLSEFGHENLKEVKFCLVMECNEFRTIIDSEKLYRGKDGRAESEDFPDFDEAMVLGSLERLIIRYIKNMESIWKGPVGKGSLSNLKSLALHTCPNLTTLFTIDMLSNLIKLEELIVEDCPKINSIVSVKNSGSKSVPFLPSLKKISLLQLPGLVSISSGLCIAPKLERMVIFYCSKLEKLSSTEVSSTELKVIKGEKEWWDALKWYESDLSTEHEDYLAHLFIPFRRDGDLMAQLTEDEIAAYGQGKVGGFKILEFCINEMENFTQDPLAINIPSGADLSHENYLLGNVGEITHALPSPNPFDQVEASSADPLSLEKENATDGGRIQVVGSSHRFSLDEVRRATNGFDDALVIGIGGFGKVYKGYINNGATTAVVAIKRLNASKQAADEFWTEVKLFLELRHTHLVSLIGYCDELPEMILVHEYIACVLCGRPPVDTRLEEEQISLIFWAKRYLKKGKLDQIIDPFLAGKTVLAGKTIRQSLKSFAELADKCLHPLPKERPTMAEVVGALRLCWRGKRLIS